MNPLKQRLAAGKPALGFLLSMPSPQLAQTVAASGMDWLFIDMEHGPIDFADAHALIAATQGTACAPIVRVPIDNLAASRPVLDAGAFGLVIPMVCTAEQARRALDFLRYPPAGKRGVGPVYAPQRWGTSVTDYLARANDELVTFILIEHIDAVRNLDEILAVEGIDGALIAPFDLSASLGRPGDLEHPDVTAAVAEAERKILASKAALGGLAQTPAAANAMIAAGYRVLIVAIDAFMIQQTLGDLLGAIERDG